MIKAKSLVLSVAADLLLAVIRKNAALSEISSPHYSQAAFF